MNKRNWVYLGIFCGLILLYVLVVRPHGARGEHLKKVFDIDSTKVSRIELLSPQDTIRIERTGNTWNIVDPVKFPASAEHMKDFLHSVVNAQYSTLPLADSPADWAAYKIDDRNATTVRLYDGKKWREAKFGDNQTVRPKAHKTVYHTKYDLQYALNLNLSMWRKSEIIEVREPQMKSVDVTYSLGHYTLTQTDSVWSYQGMGKTFVISQNNPQILKVVQGLENLRTYQFVDADTPNYLSLFDQPVLNVVLTLKDGTQTRLRVVQSPDDDNTLLLRRNDETDHLFKLSGDRMTGGWLQRFTVGAEHFQGE